MNGRTERIVAAASLLTVSACAGGFGSTPSGPAGPETGDGTYVYACERDFRFSVRVHPESVDLRYGTESLSLPQIPAASGARYEGDGVTFHSRGLDAIFEGPQRTYQECEGQLATTPWLEAGMLGYDFRAVGQEPGWVVEIDFDGRTWISTDYGDTRFEVETPDRVFEDAGVTSYTARGGERDVSILVDEVPCQDSMSGQSFPAAVTLTLNGDEYEGCGQMVYDRPYSPLASVEWVLMELDGLDAIAGPGGQEVRMRFIPEESRSLAYTGCNYSIVPFTLMDDQIRFRQAIMTTSLSCTGSAIARQERGFLGMLQRVSRLEVADDELTMYTGNRVVARFAATRPI